MLKRKHDFPLQKSICSGAVCAMQYYSNIVIGQWFLHSKYDLIMSAHTLAHSYKACKCRQFQQRGSR